jgi:hypothetical protein
MGANVSRSSFVKAEKCTAAGSDISSTYLAIYIWSSSGNRRRCALAWMGFVFVFAVTQLRARSSEAKLAAAPPTSMPKTLIPKTFITALSTADMAGCKAD